MSERSALDEVLSRLESMPFTGRARRVVAEVRDELECLDDTQIDPWIRLQSMTARLNDEC